MLACVFPFSDGMFVDLPASIGEGLLDKFPGVQPRVAPGSGQSPPVSDSVLTTRASAVDLYATFLASDVGDNGYLDGLADFSQ